MKNRGSNRDQQDWQENDQRDDDWARQVPTRRPDLPYDDYGWERGTSGLPEFRDPSARVMPWERDRVERWRHLDQTPAGDYGVQGWWDQPGPHRGKGPKNYRRSDEQIKDDICERLTQHGYIDASNVQVDVQNGEVTLNGEVNSRQEKRLAEDVTDSVSGVQDVNNRLRLSGMPGSGAGRKDVVGHTGVYPASSGNVPADAEAHGMASWGQGSRGAEGYEDSGQSEIRVDPENKDRQ